MRGITYAIIGCDIDKGMKSKGSKFLFDFNSEKLLDFQINQIKNSNKNNYEIMVITNFEIQKIQKTFGTKIKIIEADKEINAITKICQTAKYKNIFFIDYGCIFTKKILSNIPLSKSFIISIQKHKNIKLDIGATVDNDNNIKHMFFDLPDHQFTNMFFLEENIINFLISQKSINRNNLMYFEIINFLIDNGFKIKNHTVEHKTFIYFNSMRQKYEINRFVTKNSN